MSVFAARMRLVRLLPRAGAGRTATLVVLQLVRSAIPAVQALAVGRLVARLFGGGHPIAAAVLVAGLFLIDQLVWLLIAPVRHFVDQVRAATSQGAVTVLVSHRFTTVRMADLIVVLADGRIAEQGTHAELMAADGDYAELYRLQEHAYR